jgi:mannosyltransferase
MGPDQDAAMRAAESGGGGHLERWLLAGAVALAAALRFSALDARGWWRDEAVTVQLLRLPFDELLRAIPESEGTPPLYYVIAWGWTRVFADSEAGLRSLSALFGTIVVVVVYLVGQELVSRRAGIVAAFLAAVSPLLVWHAQDARSYSLLVLLSGLSFLFFLRLRRTGSPLDAIAFGLASALALATHYFAVFLIVPQTAWLLAERPTRRLAAGPAAVIALVALALLPLVAAQRGNVSWISDVPRWRRLVEVAQEFLVGPQAPWERITTVAAGLLVVVALVIFALRGSGPERRVVGPALTVGLAALALPVLLALIGFDYVLGRNVIVAWVPLMILVAAALTARRAGVAGVVLAGALVALGAMVVVASASTPKFGAEDWRGVARELGPPPAGGRAIVLWPPEGAGALGLYRPSARGLPAQGARVTEVVVATLGNRRRDADFLAALAPATPFRLRDRRDHDHFTVARFVADKPVVVTNDALGVSPPGTSAPAVLQER